MDILLFAYKFTGLCASPPPAFSFDAYATTPRICAFRLEENDCLAKQGIHFAQVRKRVDGISRCRENAGFLDAASAVTAPCNGFQRTHTCAVCISAPLCSRVQISSTFLRLAFSRTLWLLGCSRHNRDKLSHRPRSCQSARVQYFPDSRPSNRDGDFTPVFFQWQVCGQSSCSGSQAVGFSALSARSQRHRLQCYLGSVSSSCGFILPLIFGKRKAGSLL